MEKVLKGGEIVVPGLEVGRRAEGEVGGGKGDIVALRHGEELGGGEGSLEMEV